MSTDHLNWNCPGCGARYNHADNVQACLQTHDIQDPLHDLEDIEGSSSREGIGEMGPAYHNSAMSILQSIEETIQERASGSMIGSYQTPASFLPGEINGFNRATFKHSKSLASSLSYRTASSYPLSFHSAVSDMATAQDVMFLPSTMRGQVASRTSQMPANRPEVFSSAWLSYLDREGIILPPEWELDWSGRGQHVEYQPGEEQDIPLRVEKVLGYSASALVESVMCRRIRLARKKIRCGRRLTKEDAINEVRHLQNCQHSHIVRVVGTYTISNQLSILLYPAARWNLEEFMEAIRDPGRDVERISSLRTFVFCLSRTISWLHDQNVKHMDIKPKNILIRQLFAEGRMSIMSKNRVTRQWWVRDGIDVPYKVYLADFGIARAYQSAKDSETDSPTAYTPTYAAPEVVQQDTRGLSADIFSLGCVFMEIIATLICEKESLKAARLSPNGNSSYHANVKGVQDWCVIKLESPKGGLWHLPRTLLEALPSMINEEPGSRPTASAIVGHTIGYRCHSCDNGPEPFEAADSQMMS